jgi:hypothetical protein
MIVRIIGWFAGVWDPTDEAFQEAFPESIRETLVCVP